MSRPDCPSEETLHEFLLRRAQGGTTGALEDHLDTCDDCRRLVGRLAGLGLLLERPPEGVTGDLISPQHASFALIPGATIGRFTLIEKVGAGAMGQVFAAQDPKLDRKIALKILRKSTSWGSDIEARILSEAQSLARIFHPNVVTVYDVGFDGGHFFMAMALIEGTTLRRWAVGRTPTEIIAQYAAAGRGLVAAHRQGVVHGDFKPDNVLVDLHGNVFVTDFGLARFFTPSDATPAAGSTAGGTPRYMAPEQHRGQLTAAADQYSLAVALYESLFGEPPFRADDMPGLIAQKNRGVSGMPPQPQLAIGVQKALLRALAPEPADRFVEMEHLLSALTPPARPRRWGWALGLAALGVAGIGLLQIPRPPACATPEVLLSEAFGSQAQAEIQDHFGRHLPPPRATQAFAILQNYANAWATASHQTCLAMGTAAADEMLRLRPQRDCWRARQLGLHALIALFRQGDPQVIGRAVETTAILAPLQACYEMADEGSGPVEPDAREAPLRAELAEAGVLAATGAFAPARVRVAHVITAATEQNLRAVMAEALLARAELERLDDDYPSALATLKETTRVATAANQREAAARSQIRRMSYLTHLRRYTEAHEARQEAEAQLEAAGGSLRHVRAGLLQELTLLFQAEGRLEEASETSSLAIARTREVFGLDSFAVSRAELVLAYVELERGRPDLARRAGAAALAFQRGFYGPAMERQLVGALHVVGEAEATLGDTAAALKHLEEAQSIADRVHGDTSRLSGIMRLSRAQALLVAERWAEADSLLTAHLTLTTEPAQRIRGHLNLARAKLGLGQPRAARIEATQAERASRNETLPPRLQAELGLTVGLIEAALQRRPAAQQALATALAAVAHQPPHPLRCEITLALAELQRPQNSAVALVERLRSELITHGWTAPKISRELTDWQRRQPR